MFTDRIRVKLIAGKGGNGIVAWRREKYLPKGGPTGGNGGPGGAVVFKADPEIFSLDWYKNRRILKAENGGSGGPNQRQGKKGGDLVLRVPCGTIIRDINTEEILSDLTDPSSLLKICLGGKGGLGNAFFKSATNQAPAYSTLGKEGDAIDVELELKLVADIGFVGWPNAGKSTLLAALTQSQAKIGAYPFTTLSPNLGYLELSDYRQVVLADIPGIIEKAHLNKGLGLEFLRHIERTKALFFVIDGAAIDGRDPIEDFRVLLRELQSYNTEILNKPFFILLNKCDEDDFTEKTEHFLENMPQYRDRIISISARDGRGLNRVLERIESLNFDQE